MSESVQGKRMWQLLAALLVAAVAAQTYYIVTLNHKVDELGALEPSETILAPPIQSIAQAAPVQPIVPAPRRPLTSRMTLNMPPDPFDHMAAMSKMFNEFFGDEFTSMPSLGTMSAGSAPQVKIVGKNYVVP